MTFVRPSVTPSVKNYTRNLSATLIFEGSAKYNYTLLFALLISFHYTLFFSGAYLWRCYVRLKTDDLNARYNVNTLPGFFELVSCVLLFKKCLKHK